MIWQLYSLIWYVTVYLHKLLRIICFIDAMVFLQVCRSSLRKCTEQKTRIHLNVVIAIGSSLRKCTEQKFLYGRCDKSPNGSSLRKCTEQKLRMC